MQNAQLDVSGMLREVKTQEMERVIKAFLKLANQIDQKANRDDGEAGLAFVACAASVRRVCDETRQEMK